MIYESRNNWIIRRRRVYKWRKETTQVVAEVEVIKPTFIPRITQHYAAPRRDSTAKSQA